GEFGHALEVEIREGLAKSLALAQDRQPRQAGLEPLQADLLEKTPVVRDRPPPLMVVIVQIVWQVAMPGTANDAVWPLYQAGFLDFHSEFQFLTATPMALRGFYQIHEPAGNHTDMFT